MVKRALTGLIVAFVIMRFLTLWLGYFVYLEQRNEAYFPYAEQHIHPDDCIAYSADDPLYPIARYVYLPAIVVPCPADTRVQLHPVRR